MFWGCFGGVLRGFKGCFWGVLGVFWGCLGGGRFKGCFRRIYKVLRVFLVLFFLFFFVDGEDFINTTAIEFVGLGQYYSLYKSTHVYDKKKKEQK